MIYHGQKRLIRLPRPGAFGIDSYTNYQRNMMATMFFQKCQKIMMKDYDCAKVGESGESLCMG